MYTSKDSRSAICPFGDSNSYPWEAIGSALWSSDGHSSPSYNWNISDLLITVTFILYYLGSNAIIPKS